MSVCVQQIDEMLAGSLTQEDEEAVLAELEAITQVCTWTLSDSPCYWCCVGCCDFIYCIHVMCVRRKKLTLNFLRCLKKNYQRFQSKVCVFFSTSVINVQHANAKNFLFMFQCGRRQKRSQSCWQCKYKSVIPPCLLSSGSTGDPQGSSQTKLWGVTDRPPPRTCRRPTTMPFFLLYIHCILYTFSLEDYSEILLTVPGLSNHPTVLSDLSYIKGISCQCLYISNACITFIITISCLNWFPNISVLNTPCFVTNNTKLNRLIIMNSSINLYTLFNVLKYVIKTTTMTSLF